MKRLIIVFNPRSSKAKLIREMVFEPARELAGFLVGKYEVLPTDVDDNAAKLAKILKDGDLVVTAGGDGTALIGLNGCMKSGKEVCLAAMPFGNFNDTAATLGKMKFEEIIDLFLRGKGKKFYPLEVKVDDEHFRYAIGYVTVGMMAEATAIFDEKKIRTNLRRGKRRIFSYTELAKWYFRNRKGVFLPEGKTDYMAVNGRRVGGVMRGGEWFLTRKFLSGVFDLSKVWRLAGFMTRAIFRQIPGQKTGKDILEFREETEVKVHMEGESKVFSCRKIEIAKERALRVITK